MEITVKIEAPGLMEALLAVAEQLQELNAHQAGKPVPTGAITTKAEPKKEKKAEQPVIPEPQEVIEEAKEEAKEEVKEVAAESADVETVRALVVASKSCKAKAKEVMTEMGVKKLTELSAEQLTELYKALQEV